ncbi:MAG: formylglycine-generating enzyme family protein [Candidatus Brocadiia bacterium]
MKRSAAIVLLSALAVCFLAQGCAHEKPGKTDVPIKPAVPFAKFTDSFGIAFIPISSGTSKIGTDDVNSTAGPAYEAEVGDFFISDTEITVEIWTKYFKMNRHHKWGLWESLAKYAPDDQCPVISISRDDAEQFCKYVSEVEDAEYRLPTEEEWEYAARQGNSREVYDEAALVKVREQWKYTHPVRALPPDETGLYGMCDNAWEWTSSDYRPYKGSKGIDPLFRLTTCVLRGGGFYDPCEVWTRHPSSPVRPNYDYGFRVLRELK